MQLTLKEVLKLECLKNAKIITNNYDMNTIIDFVDVIEVPDVYSWVRPNTFLITAAYAIKDDIKAQVNLISKLSDSKAAALAIKSERFIGEIPDLMIKEANKLNFPLLQLPNNILYSDVISNISELIFNKKTESLHKTMDINNTFIKVLLEGGSFNEIAMSLSTITTNPILIEDMEFNILGFSNDVDDMQIKDKLHNNILFSHDRYRLALKNKENKSPILYKINKTWICAILPIQVLGETLGFLTMFKGNKSRTVDETAMKHAAIAIALELNRVRLYRNEKLLMEEQIINKLLSNDNNIKNNLASQIVHFEWPINQNYISIALRPEISKKSSNELKEDKNINIKRLMQVLGNNHYPDDRKIINYIDNQNILFFICLSSEEAEDYKNHINIFVRNILEKSQQLMVNSYIGIGIPVKNIYDIKLSYNKSTIALEVGKKIYIDKQIFFYDELDFYEIIKDYEPRYNLNNYYNKYIGPLIEYQENNTGLDLIHTLEIYLKSGCSLVKASENLYIHRNTLIYRLDKIREILRYNLDDPEIQFRINFALRIYKYLK